MRKDRIMEQEQIDKLNKQPERKDLATRKQAGQNLTYIEGWYVIEKANEIFGVGKWERRFTGGDIIEVNKEAKEVNGRKRFDIAVTCQYMVRVEFGDTSVSHEDIGYGSGNSYNSFGDAYESAVKEAVTDALKRCLRSFGNAFGNCLYNKKWLKGETAQTTTKPQAKPADPTTEALKSELMNKMVTKFGPVLPPAEKLKAFVDYLFAKFEIYPGVFGDLTKKITGLTVSQAEAIVAAFNEDKP
jgi:DNA repair and recombination protein RAD52